MEGTLLFQRTFYYWWANLNCIANENG